MSIIGINGKIGSGKDTVGKIIQYLTLGEEFAKTNADVVADLEHDGYCANKSKFEIKKFAGKLKLIGSILLGVPVEMFEDQDFKKSYLGEQWAKTPVAPLSDATLFDKVDLNNLMTYREFLQKLGTEAMRDGLHTNVWVNALFADYKAGDPEWDAFYPNWIITDMRFPNEMDAVVEKGGLTIRVVRNQIKTGNLVLEHPSETALDDAKFDYEIINDGTLEDLVEKVRTILIKEKII